MTTPPPSTPADPGAATLADVATMATVSPATVSRYFNAAEKLSPQTREKVRLAVERLGYVPNLVAGGLASNRSRLIAVIVPSIAQSIFSTTIQAMTDALSDAGYSVMLGLTGGRDERVDEAVTAALGQRPDGIILTGDVTSTLARARLKAASVPVIETWDLPTDPIDQVVGFSHEAVGRAVARHVLARGRRKALLISAQGARAMRRQQGFTEVFRAAGVEDPACITFSGATTFGQGRRSLASYLDAGGRPDVVVCMSDWSAHGAMAEAQARSLRVPEDLAIVGFGDLDFAADTEPPLTTVRIDGAAVAREAVALLLQDRSQAGRAAYRADIGFELIARGSC